MGIRQSEQRVQSQFTTDQDGNPTGGRTTMFAPAELKIDGELGITRDDGMPLVEAAISINWQDGIVGPDGQNGAFVEDVIEAARQRIQFFNSNPKFRCRENSLAITKLEEALQWLDWRTRQRQLENVENTYESHSGDPARPVVDPESFIGQRPARPGEES